MKTPQELSELFRSRGLKLTPQRQCIFELLDGNQLHPTAEAVFASARQAMPMISLKTVYQTLNDLAAMGEIQAVDVGTGATRFDPNVDQHHHLVCTGCGRVRDLYADFAGLRVPDDRTDGFRTMTAEVVFRGLCLDCQP